MGGIMGEAALAAYMANKGGGSASDVYLTGSTPENQNAACLGKYTKLGQICEFRHVYQSEDGQISMWWAASGVDDEFGNPTTGSWYVGPTTSVGTRAGYMRATENTDVPEEVSAMWQVFYDGKLHDAPLLKVLNAEQHTTQVLTSLVGAARRIAIRGRTNEGMDVYSAFGFSKLTQTLLGTGADAVPEIVHQRYTYRSEDGAYALWFVDAPATWVCGLAADIGSRSGLMVVADDARLPEKMTAAWQIFEDNNWSEASGIKCVAQEEEMEA